MLRTTGVFAATLLATACVVAKTTAPNVSSSKKVPANIVTEHKPPSGEVRCRAGQTWLDDCRRCVCLKDGTLRCEVLPCNIPGRPPPVVDGFVLPPHDHFKSHGVDMDHEFHSKNSDSAKGIHKETHGAGERSESDSKKDDVDSVASDEEDGNGNYDDYEKNDGDMDVPGSMPEHTLKGYGEDSRYRRPEDDTRLTAADPSLLAPEYQHASVKNPTVPMIPSPQNPETKNCQHPLHQRPHPSTQQTVPPLKQTTGYRVKSHPNFSKMDEYNEQPLSNTPYQYYSPLQLPVGPAASAYITRERPYHPRHDHTSSHLPKAHTHIVDNHDSLFLKRSLGSLDNPRHYFSPFHPLNFMNHRRSVPMQYHVY